ncbi:hypothetical protein EDD76_108225 [Kineothrix alysoides]|uniref:Uncharacterized protein n=1 Tax=Kineothrix alysoides TaxID=1469948 RepID=A0A4R1QYI3_9FIRM|nr:hypothetical protein [Kineothrix alysoides]TCL57690.1 hypothetical protein EDD76_108225 [Kineothrix alysoides]
MSGYQETFRIMKAGMKDKDIMKRPKEEDRSKQHATSARMKEECMSMASMDAAEDLKENQSMDMAGMDAAGADFKEMSQSMSMADAVNGTIVEERNMITLRIY